MLKNQITVSEKFQVEYPPSGLDPFHEAQETGSQVIIEAVKWNDIDIIIEFEANPLPSKGIMTFEFTILRLYNSPQLASYIHISNYNLEQIRWHIVRDTSDLSIILLPGEASHRMLASTSIINNTVNNDSFSPPKVYTRKYSDFSNMNSIFFISRY